MSNEKPKAATGRPPLPIAERKVVLSVRVKPSVKELVMASGDAGGFVTQAVEKMGRLATK